VCDTQGRASQGDRDKLLRNLTCLFKEVYRPRNMRNSNESRHHKIGHQSLQAQTSPPSTHLAPVDSRNGAAWLSGTEGESRVEVTFKPTSPASKSRLDHPSLLSFC
jgi:hypothetical protein